MFNVATLRHLAKTMSGEDFVARVGPFMLVRRPDAAQLQRRMSGLTGRTIQVERNTEQPQTRVLEFLIELEDLVARGDINGAVKRESQRTISEAGRVGMAKSAPIAT